ncbi:hypothetical protein WR25_09147 [Diploscapter pachys]|uniref:Uncharacterized protein n=1 Tax=Diploscapter pachys TaxID=2018661 RepID=A0A2A2LI36_9BILA|nr:hypothetical protein WR25_09147 [Diploscapter pachys]
MVDIAELAQIFPEVNDTISEEDIKFMQKINLIVQDNSKQVGERIVDIRKLSVPYVRKKMGKEGEKVTDVEIWKNQVPRLNSLVNKNDQWMTRLNKDDVNDKVKALEAEIRKLDQALEMYTKGHAFVGKTLKEALEKSDEDTLKKYIELRHEIFA